MKAFFTILISAGSAMGSLLLNACGSGSEVTVAENLLSGSTSKGWRALQEVGSNDAASQRATTGQEQLWFFANGTYHMRGESGEVEGTYIFDEQKHRISMKPEGATSTTEFTVANLTENRLTLKAASGQALALEVDDKPYVKTTIEIPQTHSDQASAQSDEPLSDAEQFRRNEDQFYRERLQQQASSQAVDKIIRDLKLCSFCSGKGCVQCAGSGKRQN